MRKNGKICIGTSGWSYEHWRDVFYPQNLTKEKWLVYYAKHFKTVELNTSFYHLPKTKTFSNWAKQTPKDFIFSVKASRFITHIKRLNDAKEPWQRFINSAKELKGELGPILFQLPPNLKADSKRLEKFLKILPLKYLYTIEPRHPSWFKREIYQILKKYNIALCIADSPDFPTEKIITAAFVYIRFHGGKVLYGSNYSDQELKKWAKEIKKWIKQGIGVYAYFNNDSQGYAIKNALRLKEMLNLHT